MTAANEPNCMVPMEMRLRKRKTTDPLSSKATWLGGNKRKMEKLEIPTKNSLSRPLKASAALATRMAAMVLTRSRSPSSQNQLASATNLTKVAQMPRLLTQF